MEKLSIQQLKERLTEHGVKATTQRLIIYQVLFHSHEHPTAEAIFESIRQEHPSISLGTVYKTLDTLVEAGLARKVKTGDDVFRFDAKTESHSHLYCTRTNKIIDYEDRELMQILEEYFRKKRPENFKISDIQLHISGELTENK